MARFVKNRSAAHGKSPGEPVFIGRKKVNSTTVCCIRYDLDHMEELPSRETYQSEIIQSDSFSVNWIDITGLHDTRAMVRIADQYGIHPLAIEDIVNTGERPKFEDFSSHLCIVVKMMRLDAADGKIHSEQLGVVVRPGLVVTFQEQPGDVFDPVRERIRQGTGRIRRMGADYLAYVLLDTIVDNYLILIEHLGEHIEDVETKIIDGAGESEVKQISMLRRELHFLYSSIRPARDAIRELGHADTEILDDTTKVFIRDLHDLALQAVESMDTYRDMLKDQLEMVSANSATRLNEVMKFSTVFSAIFMPMALLAGIYGTNFHFMPELHWKYSYPVFICLLGVVASIMIWVFKRKKWL